MITLTGILAPRDAASNGLAASSLPALTNFDAF
jgi:hypothetical protein